MTNPTLRARHPSFVLAAAVASVFATLVGTLLLFGFAYRFADPLETPDYLALKEELRTQPDSDRIHEEIRALDLTLRKAYFRHRRFTTWGAYLLLGGVAVGLSAAKAAATLQRRLPRPPASDGEQDAEVKAVRWALWGVGGVSLLLVAASIGLWVAIDSELPRDVAQLALAVEAEIPTEDHLTTSPNENLPGDVPTKARPGQGKPGQGKPTPVSDGTLSNWPRFRGAQGAGVSATADMPTSWDGASGKGILWKIKTPLPGKSSAVLWQDNVFLTGATEERREVYCYDANTGELRWGRELPKESADAEPPEVSEDTGFAAPTTATDGNRVYASFANGDLAAFDMEGQQAWYRSLGVPKNAYGHAASLAIHQELLFVQFDQGGTRDKISKLYAVNAGTGETVWEVPREVPNSWATPIVIEYEGTPLVITCGAPWVIAYDARDGKEIWRTKSLSQDVGPSPIFAKGMVFVANEYPGVSAIRLGGRGDVTESHVAWFSDWGAPDTCSPLVAGDLLLLLASYGTLMCFDAVEGGEEPLWEEEIDDSFRASPGLAGEHVYLFGESGKAWILRPTREACAVVAECDLGEGCVTSPAFQNTRIYIRGDDHLFCIGEG